MSTSNIPNILSFITAFKSDSDETEAGFFLKYFGFLAVVNFFNSIFSFNSFKYSHSFFVITVYPELSINFFLISVLLFRWACFSSSF